ncbi:MAG: hypothetical protein N2035_08850 [Chthoniobacterales bacterium]|nr:hypothetical protein [Chthoniobacterales bacterium]
MPASKPRFAFAALYESKPVAKVGGGLHAAQLIGWVFGEYLPLLKKIGPRGGERREGTCSARIPTAEQAPSGEEEPIRDESLENAEIMEEFPETLPREPDEVPILPVQPFEPSSQ